MRCTFSTILAGCGAVLIAGTLAVAQPRIGGGGGGGPGGGGTAPGGGQQQGPAGGGQIIQGTTPELTAQMLQRAKFTNVEVFTDNQGKRQVRGSINEVPTAVWHRNCENNNCLSISFYTNFPPSQGVDINWVNAWNAQKSFIKGYIAPDGRTHFEMDVHFVGGTAPTFIAGSAAIWALTLKELFEFQPQR